MTVPRVCVKEGSLGGPLIAHCFWSPRCKHTVSDRPDAAQAAMEAHYTAAHGRDIDRTLGVTRKGGKS